ncbi:hypothetical protein JCM10207_002111, partial [Rhodosporidiobolus poonsookiae]
QRSQRFTVPVSPPRSSSSPLPPLPTDLNPHILPYQPPPPPVQTQSIPHSQPPPPPPPPPAFNLLAPTPLLAQGQTSFYDTAMRRDYSSGSSSGAGDYDGDAGPGAGGYGAYHPYRPHPLPSLPSLANGGVPDFLGAPIDLAHQFGHSGGSAHRSHSQTQRASSPGPTQLPTVGKGGKLINEDGDEVIETAIVIKSIPFAATKEQLLSVIHSLALPPPFAFNFHYDSGQFRGLAFANYRQSTDAALTVSALNGFEFLGRKLRAEFKRALKPGEKEAIEREKALKRMRSAQILASQPTNPALTLYGAPYGLGGVGVGGVGGEGMLGLGPPQGGWNRREASAPSGYPGYPAQGVPPHLHAPDDSPEDYGRPLPAGHGLYATSAYAPAPAPAVSPAPSSAHGHGRPLAFGAREFVPAAAGMEASYSNGASSGARSSPPLSESDVGTSVSQRMGGASVSTSEGEDGRGEARGRGGELDFNDPTSLELYSRCLLFRDDALRDELAFSRSLTTAQRRTVHLVAKKLGLEHRSEGEGVERCVVVYKPGRGPGEPRRLRGSASTMALRRPPSRTDLLSTSPSPSPAPGSRLFRSSSPLSSATSASPAPSSFLSPSASTSALSSLALQSLSLGGQAAGLRGKKSMPDIRYSRDGHFLPRPSSTSSSSSVGLGPAFGLRSESPAPPLPASNSLHAHLAAYQSGSGFASQAASLSEHAGGRSLESAFAPLPSDGERDRAGVYSTPQARRSAANLRGEYLSPPSNAHGHGHAPHTIAHLPPGYGASSGGGSAGMAHSASAGSLAATPTRAGRGAGQGERGSVFGLFASEPPSPASRDDSTASRNFWAGGAPSTPGKAEPVRMPRGPGTPGAQEDEGMEWRRR